MRTRRDRRPVEILLVEDNAADVRLIQEALREGRVLNRLRVAMDGAEALARLRDVDGPAVAVRPDLILLDLNLPGIDGLEVLAEIKNEPSLRRTPVIVLTSSAADEDVLRSYDLHANSYVTKPLDLDEFLRAVRLIEDFWLEVVTLPPGE